MRKSLFAVSMLARHGRRGAGLRHQEVRAHRGRRRQLEGRHAERHGRRNAGAHAAERRAHRCRSIRRPKRPARAATERPRRGRLTRPPLRPTTVDDRVDHASDNRVNTRSRLRRASPRLRSHAQRGSGQLQVRQDRCCRTKRRRASTRWSPSSRPITKNIFIEIEGHTDNVGATDHQRAARPGARRGREAVSLRAAPDSAAQDERDQLRRREAGRAEQQPRRPRAEPPRRRQGALVTNSRAHFSVRVL